MSDLLELGLAPTGQEPARRKRRGSVFVVISALVLVSALIAGMVVVKGMIGKPALKDYPGPGHGTVTLTIDPGMSISEVGRLLVSHGVVATKSAFVAAAGANPKARTVVAGTYELQLEMPAAQAVSFLVDGTHRLNLKVTVPEGFEVDQVLQAIAKSGRITKEDLQVAARNTDALNLPPYANGHLEGFLFPATYTFEPTTTAQQALGVMVTEFKKRAALVHLESGAAALKMTPYDVLIVASIIEREAKNVDEYGKVARVIYNRLAKNMPLQMDSTLQYVRDIRKLHLSLADIADDTPYNSYIHKGLPPTPIANPGEAALRAALDPAVGTWLYFVSFKDGTTKFTDKYDEFVRLKAQAGISTPAPSPSPLK